MFFEVSSWSRGSGGDLQGSLAVISEIVVQIEYMQVWFLPLTSPASLDVGHSLEVSRSSDFDSKSFQFLGTHKYLEKEKKMQWCRRK